MQKIISDSNPVVWPYVQGTVRGEFIEPLYPNSIAAALETPEVYELLALLDAIRIGKAREKKQLWNYLIKNSIERMHENIVRIKAIVNLLKDLGQPYVFVGGATVSLYATRPVLAASIRPTNDVDVVIELATYNGYAKIDERLRSLGFINDTHSGVICRYI